MEDTNTEAIQDFLSSNNQQLNEGEKVIYFAQNFPTPRNAIGRLSMLLAFGFWLYVIMLSGDNEELNLAISLGILGIFAMVFFAGKLRNEQSKDSDYIPFAVITSEGIRIAGRFIPWGLVFHAKIRYLEGKRYLLFDLTSNFNLYELQNHNLNQSFSTKRFIFIAGKYDADLLQQKILPYWEPQSPDHKFGDLVNQLGETYNLTSNTTKTKRQLLGDYRNLSISFSYDKSFPIAAVATSIHLPKPITVYLNITQETSISILKQQIGIKDVQVGDQTLDDRFLFESSHPTQLKQLFTEEVLQRFKRLTQLGTFSWTFGKPLKSKRLKTERSAFEDSEDVLDTSLLQQEEQTTELELTDTATYDRLEFKGILHQDSENDPEKAMEFVELSLELSVLFGESLNEFKNE